MGACNPLQHPACHNFHVSSQKFKLPSSRTGLLATKPGLRIYLELSSLESHQTSLKLPSKVLAKSTFRRVARTALQDKLQILWVQQHAPLYKPLFTVIVREVCSYTTDPKVFTVTEGGIGWFDPLTLIWSRPAPVTDPKIPYKMCRYAIVDEKRLIADNTQSEFYILDLVGEQWRTTPLPPTTVFRHSPGMLHYRDTVYLFGGHSFFHFSGLRICFVSVESLHLTVPFKWNQQKGYLNHEVSSFTPCEFDSKAYLAFPDSYEIDVFDLATHQFERTLKINCQLGHDLVPCVANGELILIGKYRVVRVALRGKATEARMEKLECDVRERVKPVAIGSQVFWVNTGVCYRLKLGKDPMKAVSYSIR